MTFPHRRHRPLAALALAAFALVAAACGGGGDDDAAPADTAASSPAVSDSAAPAPTGAAPAVPADTAAPAPAGPAIAPFTGLAVDDPSVLARPPLVVKIDNHPDAPPQRGLNQADVVYEEVVEGLTRFAAVFQSQDTPSAPDNPDLAAVGPIRSARTTDIDILAGLSRPLLAWSGGNAGVQRAITTAADEGELVDVGFDAHSIEAGYFRDDHTARPHNLYANMKAIYAFLAPELDGGATEPAPLFSYRAEGEAPSGGVDVVGAKLTMDSTPVQWQWDADSSSWLRLQYGRPHVDADAQPVAPANVVVMFVGYQASPADRRSPEAVTVGEGEAWVFTGGKVIAGTWSRPDRSRPAALVDEAGAPIALTPGRTWVELAPADKAVVVPADTDPETVPFPPK